MTLPDRENFKVSFIDREVQSAILDHTYDALLRNPTSASLSVERLARDIAAPRTVAQLNAVRLVRRGLLHHDDYASFAISARGIDHVVDQSQPKNSSKRVDLTELASHLLRSYESQGECRDRADLATHSSEDRELVEAAVRYLIEKNALEQVSGRGLRLTEIGWAFLVIEDPGRKELDASREDDGGREDLVQLSQGTWLRKGTFGENMIDFVLREHRWLAPLFGHSHIGVRGFDALFTDTELSFLIVAEAKYRKHPLYSLKSLLNMTKTKGRQMTKYWIRNTALELRKEFPDLTDSIVTGLNDDKVERMVLVFNVGAFWIMTPVLYEEDFIAQGIN